jgi:NAD(P)H-dependent flavin oxidoreductase YrpB (nitropropane dioxygenase family)
MAGQSAGMVNDIRPAAEIITSLFSEAREVLQKIYE